MLSPHAVVSPQGNGRADGGASSPDTPSAGDLQDVAVHTPSGKRLLPSAAPANGSSRAGGGVGAQRLRDMTPIKRARSDSSGSAGSAGSAGDVAALSALTDGVGVLPGVEQDQKSPFTPFQRFLQVVVVEMGVSVCSQVFFFTLAEADFGKYHPTMMIFGKYVVPYGPITLSGANNTLGNFIGVSSSSDWLGTLRNSGDGHAGKGFVREVLRYTFSFVPTLVVGAIQISIRPGPFFGGDLAANTLALGTFGVVLFQAAKKLVSRPASKPLSNSDGFVRRYLTHPEQVVPRNDDDWKSVSNWMQWLLIKPYNDVIVTLSYAEMLRYIVQGLEKVSTTVANADITESNWFPVVVGVGASLAKDAIQHVAYTPKPLQDGMFTEKEKEKILRDAKYGKSESEFKISNLTKDEKDTAITNAAKRRIGLNLIKYGTMTVAASCTTFFWSSCDFLGFGERTEKLTDVQKLARTAAVTATYEGAGALIRGGMLLYQGLFATEKNVGIPRLTSDSIDPAAKLLPNGGSSDAAGYGTRNSPPLAKK